MGVRIYVCVFVSVCACANICACICECVWVGVCSLILKFDPSLRKEYKNYISLNGIK